MVKWAAEEGISVTQLLGYLLYLDNYHKGERSVSAVGWQIFQEEKFSDRNSASLEEALWLIERASLSQAVYLEIQLRFLDRFVLPSVMNVVSGNQKHRPQLSPYCHGVRAPLHECLSKTLSERIQLLDLTKLNGIKDVKFKFTWGLDGSGEHGDYNQLSKVHFSTKQIMSVCFSLKEVMILDSARLEVGWNSTEIGANKTQNVRPLALFPAKEDKGLLEDFIPKVEEEIAKISSEGVVVILDGEKAVNAICDKLILSMADGKMVTTLLQLGGAYCTMCTKSLGQCHDKRTIGDGFIIDRSIENLRELALSLTDPDSGDIQKKKGDYETRQGVCDMPITESDITKHIPVCHAK